MSEFSITITTPDGLDDPQELAGALAVAVGQTLLGDAAGAPVSAILETVAAPEGGGSEEPSIYTGPEGAASLRRLLGEIAPNTRIAVRVIAEASIDGGGIHAIKLRERLGLGSPSALAGVLTSLGFAQRRTGLPKPYTQDWAQLDGAWGNEYTMEPEIARTILELVADDGRVQTP